MGTRITKCEVNRNIKWSQRGTKYKQYGAKPDRHWVRGEVEHPWGDRSASTCSTTSNELLTWSYRSQISENSLKSTYPIVRTWTLISIPVGSFVLAWEDCLKDSFISFDNSISWIMVSKIKTTKSLIKNKHATWNLEKYQIYSPISKDTSDL